MPNKAGLTHRARHGQHSKQARRIVNAEGHEQGSCSGCSPRTRDTPSLQVYKGAKHDHEAQQPQDITKEISIKPKNGPGAQLLAAKKASA